MTPDGQLVSRYEVFVQRNCQFSEACDSLRYLSIIDHQLSIINRHHQSSSSIIVQAYQSALGIKTMAWAPSSNILALGSYDEKLRLLNRY
jgi:hypothetical protein